MDQVTFDDICDAQGKNLQICDDNDEDGDGVTGGAVAAHLWLSIHFIPPNQQIPNKWLQFTPQE